MTKLNWWTVTKVGNEKTYTKYCGHRDLAFTVGQVECRSCHIKQPWDGKSYTVKLPRIKYEA